MARSSEPSFLAEALAEMRRGPAENEQVPGLGDTYAELRRAVDAGAISVGTLWRVHDQMLKGYLADAMRRHHQRLGRAPKTAVVVAYLVHQIVSEMPKAQYSAVWARLRSRRWRIHEDGRDYEVVPEEDDDGQDCVTEYARRGDYIWKPRRCNKKRVRRYYTISRKALGLAPPRGPQ